MLYFLISMFVMLVFLDRAVRIGRLEQVLLESRFKLFALRDELRQAAINEEVPKNKWFEYLDTTITKALDQLPRITAWEALALFVSHHRDPSILHAELQLSEAMEAEVNQGLAHFYARFLLSLVSLLAERHAATSYTMLATAKVATGVITLRDRVVKILSVAPETSTLLHYADS